MSKTQTTVVVEEDLLREAEHFARSHQATLDQVVENALRRELAAARPNQNRAARLPTHGYGGLRNEVDLEDKEAIDRLLADP